MTNILLGFVETETGVYATYNRRGEIQSNKLRLSAVQGYGEEDLTFWSHEELLESLTKNKEHFKEYSELTDTIMEYFKTLLSVRNESFSYKNMEEKIEEALSQKNLIEEMGLDPKKINVGLTQVDEPGCYGEFGEIAVEREDSVGFALAVFYEIFSWIDSCVRAKSFEYVKSSSEYQYMVTKNKLLPCVFTQFGLENYVKEWQVEEYLMYLFTENECFDYFENDFKKQEKKV